MGDVRSPGGHRIKEGFDAGLLDLAKTRLPLLPFPLFGLLAGISPAQQALLGEVPLAVLDPPAEMLAV